METPQVFISYTKADRDIATAIYDLLDQKSLNPWLDDKKIKGGQNWDFEIRRALDRSVIVVIIWSENSRDHRGYIQRELKLALRKLEENLVDDIFIVPVLVGNSLAIPDELKDIHCLAFEDAALDKKLVESIEHQFARIGKELKKTQEQERVYWSKDIRVEEWDGLPGYHFEYTNFSFSSSESKNIGEFGEFVRVSFLNDLFETRQIKFCQETDRFNYGQEKWSRQNTFYAHCDDPIIVGRALSLNYVVSNYYARAAHPVHWHRTFNFVIEPAHSINSFSQLLNGDADQTFGRIQELVRRELLNYEVSSQDESEEDAPYKLDKEQVFRGTESWNDLKAFVLNKDNVEFYFGSYQVAAYAFGMPHIALSYGEIEDQLKDQYKFALGLAY